MRHQTARQLERDGQIMGWHYVSASSRGGYPLGYCAEHPPHETEQQARECYAKYQRDHVRLDRKTLNWCGCEYQDCDKPTKTGADIMYDGYHLAMLCEEHLTKDCAIEALGLSEPAGDAWVS